MCICANVVLIGQCAVSAPKRMPWHGSIEAVVPKGGRSMRLNFAPVQGTNSSKKKKKNKLKRVMQTVKKHERRSADKHQEAFAAMQLLHDPQVQTP